MKKFYLLLNCVAPSFKKRFFLIAFLLVSVSFLEVLGIGLLIPFTSIVIESKTNLIFLNKFDQSQKLLFLIITIMGFFLFKFLYLKSIIKIQGKFSYDFYTYIGNKLFYGYLSKNINFFFQKHKSSMVQELVNEVGHLNSLVNSFLYLAGEVLVLSAIIIFIIFVDPLASIITISVFSFSAYLFLIFFKKKLITHSSKRQKFDFERIKVISESLNSITEIKFYNKENLFSDIYNDFNFKASQSKLSEYVINNLPRLWTELTAIFTVILVLIYFSFINLPINTILPKLVVFAAAAFRIIPSINRILNNLNSIRFYEIVLDSLLPPLREIDQSKDIFKFQKNLKKSISDFSNFEIKNLEFDYGNPRKRIFKNFNFKFKRGDMIGIHGASGSGKSTLVHILLGLLKAKKGYFYLDNKLIKNFNDLNLSNFFGYVPQKIHIFDENISYNILFGLEKNKENMVKLKKVLQILNLKNFIKPHYLNGEYKVGENASKLSGGQIQRLAIARAIIKDPKVLILDEATNALDPKTEKNIFNSLIKLNKEANLTIIIISHNMNIINKCKRKISISE